MFSKSIKKLIINTKFSIFKIIELNYFLYLFSILKNIKRIVSDKNLNSLNRIFKQLNIKFRNNSFYIDILTIDNISKENNCFGLIREIIFKNVYLSKFIFRDPAKNDCIDLGSNIGVFSLIAAKTFNSVCGVEPQIKYTECYHKLMVENNIKNYFLINGHVGNSNEFNRDQVNIIDFNKLVEENSLNNIFLKIDIEGAEFQLFENINLNKVMGISMEVHQYKGNMQNILSKLEIFQFDYIVCDDLGECVKNYMSANYIYAAKKNSHILLKK